MFSRLNLNPMGEGQYGQHVVGGNPRAYMTMRDYRNLAWQNQQLLGRNSNPNRSMWDYRDQWMSAPIYSVPSTYAPPPHPQYASLSQPQLPQPISPVEQAILDLTKLVGDVVGEQKKFNAQLSQKIHTVENSQDQRLDGLQSEMDKKIDNLHYPISRPAQQHDHQEGENLEEECQSETMVEEPCLQQPQEGLVENFEPSDIGAVVCPWEKKEETSPMLTEEGSGKEEGEEPQKLILYLNPINLDPFATAQATKCPLPVAPSTDQVYILPTPAAQSTPKAPTTKATPSLLVLQNIRKLVVTVQASATTSKTQAAAYIAWHSGWFGCRFGFGAPEPRHS